MTTKLLSSKLKQVDLRNYLRRRRTYPGLFPILPLDHIYYDGPLDIIGVEVARTPLALVASDHLPLIADVRIRRSG
jgi:endonuclease/exonuclease/phosphatase family metal-dependent hydrolase